MKNLQVLSWGLARAALTACVNLDEQLVGTVTTTYFTTPAGLEAAVDGDYAQLRDFFGREESFAVTEFGTDLTTNGGQGGSNVAHRAPVDSVYLQIVKDLREAIPDLPVTQSQVGRATQGAARHLLAKVLLTRAYHPYSYEAANTDFYLSGSAFLREPGATSATDFTAARAEADSVIAGPYTLLTNYVDIFCAPMGARGPSSYCNVPANETNSEVIWSVQFTTTAGLFNTGGGNALFVQMLSFYDDRQGMARDGNNGRGFRRARPTLYARNLWQRWTDSTYATTLDTRYDGTFQSVWHANAANTGACFMSQGAARMN